MDIEIDTEITGNTYYVAKDGNDSNPGTESEPWLTISKAADTLKALSANDVFMDSSYNPAYPTGTADVAPGRLRGQWACASRLLSQSMPFNGYLTHETPPRLTRRRPGPQGAQ